MSEAKKWPQYFASVCICIGAWGTGTILGWTSTVSQKLSDGNLGGLKMTENHKSLVGSLMTLGAMITCFPVGYLTDKIGRKPTVLITVIPFILGWALIMFPQHMVMVYIGRFLTGIAGGAFCVVAPLYTTEIAQIEIRGRLGTFFQLFITIGILYAYVFGAVIPKVQLYVLLCAVIPIIFAVLFFFQPESPLYSLKKGKPEQCAKTMERLRGADYDASAEIKLMQDQIATEAELKEQFWKTLKTRPGIKSNIICLTLMFYQQLCGINAVIFFTSDIFGYSGSKLDPNLSTMIVGIVQVIATVFASYFIEKFGRKNLLMASGGLMGLATVLLGIYFTMNDRKLLEEATLKSLGFIPIMSLIIFIIAFSIGFGPIPWLASGELFAQEIKALCSSAAATFNWFLAFLVTVSFHSVKDAIGMDITFYIFSAISFSSIIFVLLVMPETKGKSIPEIQSELAGK